MKSTTKAIAATVGATALVVASCSNSGSSTTETVTATDTTTASAPADPTTSAPAPTGSDDPSAATTAPASAGVDMSALKPDCSLGIEATAVQAILDRDSVPVVHVNGPHDGEVTGLSILKDAYSPCDGLSYAVLGGDYKGEPAAFPVFFSHGATIGNVASFLGSPDMDITGGGNTITATSTFQNVTFTGTYTADQFGSVTERSQGAGTKNVDLSAIGEFFDAAPVTRQYNFPISGGIARCIVGPAFLECENPFSTWAFNRGEQTKAIHYDYGAHEMKPVDRIDDTKVLEEVALNQPHTVVGPAGHLMDFGISDDQLTITTPGEMKIRIDADTATTEMPATTM